MLVLFYLCTVTVTCRKTYRSTLATSRSQYCYLAFTSRACRCIYEKRCK